jgi:hypothetical protein
MNAQASSALIAERLLLSVFPLIDGAKRPNSRPAVLDTPPVNQQMRGGKNSRKKGVGRSNENPVFPNSLKPLTVTQLEDIVNQLLMYLGYLSLNCPENQTFASLGPPPTLLVRLCTFPIMYFSEDR